MRPERDLSEPSVQERDLTAQAGEFNAVSKTALNSPATRGSRDSPPYLPKGEATSLLATQVWVRSWLSAE